MPVPVVNMPVPVVKSPGADSLWQRSPFNLQVVWGTVPTDPAIRPPGIDVTLPYWMARSMGV